MIIYNLWKFQRKGKVKKYFLIFSFFSAQNWKELFNLQPKWPSYDKRNISEKPIVCQRLSKLHPMSSRRVEPINEENKNSKQKEWHRTNQSKLQKETGVRIKCNTLSLHF